MGMTACFWLSNPNAQQPSLASALRWHWQLQMQMDLYVNVETV
ncbi:hypothetical protein FG05_35103 [Fusarium graminearum]|nr:hypothetical protein FG05_35103 [Fusarium graminearum]